MPSLLRTVNGTTALFATTSLKSKTEGILSANFELVTNARSGISDFILNITQNACNLATIKLKSLSPTKSRLTASFGKQVRGISSANIVLTHKNSYVSGHGCINKKKVVLSQTHSGCKEGCGCKGCGSSNGRLKVKFLNGTKLKICMDKTLKAALKRLISKLSRIIKRLGDHSRRGGAAPDPACLARCIRISTICQAACGIFAIFCIPACLAAQAICIATC
ncbi:hypothetical protein PaecuDRAFT_2028 [Paenibacillus curdlanolyticus YK9]|uniref:Uncharacterized protein n=1 Tax=Paenibacillus curdlanolyticus YK9 TaxID=717606 RepID=E0I8Q0_9BACL|nr:hypothetical protein [Paenibacillus curdlanolyticus]EFM10784.1 hypothetical protein PaecuDRAFT_2028 [Paenibacillus curdlanolyticus YK9]